MPIFSPFSWRAIFGRVVLGLPSIEPSTSSFDLFRYSLQLVERYRPDVGSAFKGWHCLLAMCAKLTRRFGGALQGNPFSLYGDGAVMPALSMILITDVQMAKSGLPA